MASCPYCQNVLPEPPEQFCPNCGGDLQAAPPPVPPLPAAGAVPPGGEPPRSGTPWDRRGEIGFFPALVQTTQQVLLEPTRFFQTMPVTGGIGSPLLYGLILGTIGVVLQAVYNMLVQGMFGPMFAGGDLERMMPFLAGGAGLVVNIVVAPLFVILGMFIGSGIVHLMLMLLGGAQREFEATFRVVGYTYAASVFQLVPICGGIVAAVYSLVLAIIGVSEVHRISRGKAAAAVLLPIVLLCCCCGGLVALTAGSIASMLGTKW
jgi:hypothetical protein